MARKQGRVVAWICLLVGGVVPGLRAQEPIPPEFEQQIREPASQ
jgi:hypothetical protein